MKGFEFIHRETVRFRDVDAMGHVNNAVYLTYLEDARIAFTYLEDARIAFLRPIGADVPEMILARAEIDFRAPLAEGDELEIGVRPVHVGTKSFELAYEVRVGERVAAEAKTVIVSYDYSAGHPVEVPDQWREALAA